MLIDADTLPSMVNLGKLQEHFAAHCIEECSKALLRPVVSVARLRDAHHAWQDDMLRLQSREPHLHEGLDHFKQSANLAYWLRRMSPVVEFKDFAAELEGMDDLYPDERDLRKFLTKYGTEYLAFDFGFQVCLYYQLERTQNPSQFSPALSGEYLVDVCHMMKFKHVSPHAMFLVYKSIFI